MAASTKKNAVNTYTYTHPPVPADAPPGVKAAWAQQGREMQKLLKRMNQIATPGYVDPPKG